MKRIGAALLSMALALALAACFDGGGDAPANAADGGGNGSGAPASAFTAEQRAEATARLAIHYEQRLEAHDPSPWESLRAYTLQQPEFKDAGLGDSLLWARFTDGRYFVYTDNWSPLKIEPPSSAAAAATLARSVTAAAPAQARPLAAAPATPAAPELPDSHRAIFLKLVHEDFDHANGMIERMKKALAPHGWEFDDERTLTIDTLKKVQGQGFVFLTSHAAFYNANGVKTYGIMTETYNDPVTDLLNSADFADGTLMLSRDRGTLLSNFGRDYPHWVRSPPRITASAQFVRKYMQFAPHSLVVLMMCNGGTAGASDMRQAFFDKGAGTVMAWNGYANPGGYPAVELLVDRMTGANKPVRTSQTTVIQPPAIPNRAFEKADVISFLLRSGVLLQPGVDHPDATIEFFGEGFSLFNPVISALQVTGRDKLILHGRFGSQREDHITIGGTPVAVDRWEKDGSEIEVTLPTGRNDPPGSLGEVVVTAKGLSSNARMLTSWRGDITQVYEELYGDEPNVFRNRLVGHLHIRGDGHGVRQEVDGPVGNNAYLVSMASDSRAEWLAEGGCAICHLFQVWTGHKEDLEFSYDVDLTSPYPPDTSRPVNNLAFALIDAVDRRLQVFTMIGGTEQFTVFTYDTPPHTHLAALQRPDPGLFWPGSDPPGSGPMPGAALLNFDLGQDVAAQNHVLRVAGSNDSAVPVRHTINWGGFGAAPAFDDRIGR